MPRLPSSLRTGLSARPRARARAWTRAVCVPSKGVDRQEFTTDQVVEVLKAHDVELVCLAGFMRLLSGYFIREFPMRILNIIRRCCRRSRVSTRNIRPWSTA